MNLFIHSLFAAPCALLAMTLSMVSPIYSQQQTAGTPLFQKGFPIPQVHVDEAVEIRAEACAPATALRDLEWNNVRALIENAGALWYNRAIDKGAFMVPKEEGVSVVYGGAL